MKKRQLATSDLWVSEISFGCMSLDVHAPESIKLLQSAFDAGINFFDTADLYDKGENELLVGKALNDVRDQLIIASKVGNQLRKNGSGWDWNPTKEYILSAVENSLRRLNTDYIDLYQLHGGTIEDPINETIEAFEILKKQGKIREYGISSIRPNVIREWIQKSNMVSVMMQYSFLDRRPEEEALDLLNENGISVITRGSLAKGLLVDKPPKEYLDYNSSDIAQLQSHLKETGNPLSYAIDFVLQHPAVTSAVLGMRTNEQLASNIKAFNAEIDPQTFNRLKKIFPQNKYIKHR